MVANDEEEEVGEGEGGEGEQEQASEIVQAALLQVAMVIAAESWDVIHGGRPGALSR